MMRLNVLVDSASGRIISLPARETGCGFQDHQISAHFESPHCIKFRTLPLTLQRRLVRRTIAIGNARQAEELYEIARAKSEQCKADQELSRGNALLLRGASVPENAFARH